MRRFWLWQVWTTVLIALTYVGALILGKGRSTASFYAMISVLCVTVLTLLAFLREFLFAIKNGVKSVFAHTEIVNVILVMMAFVLADISGIPFIISVIISGLVFCLVTMVTVGAALALCVLLVMFAITFGAPIHAALATFCLAIVLGIVFVVITEPKPQYGWIILSSTVQAIVTHAIFAYGPRFVELNLSFRPVN